MAAPAHPEDVSAAAQRLARTALSLARSGSEPGGAAIVLKGLGGYRMDVVRLARARCLAAADQNPADEAARRAAEILDAVLRQLAE